MPRLKTFLGGGNMAKAMLEGLAKKETLAGYLVIEKDEQKRKALETLGVETRAEWQNKTEAVFCILAVKPQDAKTILPTLSLPPDSILCSLAAGLSVATIEALLPKKATVVRAMPNLAAAVGHAVTGLFAPLKTPANVKEEVESLFAAFGQAFWLADEKMLHAVTAMTGSGPGYLFYIMDIMAQTAKKMGFTEEANAMIHELFLGAALMAKNGNFSELATAVSSKGGTTEAALSFLEEKGLPTLLENAIFRAYERSQALDSSS